MTGQKSILSLCMVCALALSAFAAQGAAAATSTTAVTCVAGASNDFSDNHCKTASAGGGFGHVAITENTNIKGSGGETILRSTQSGINVELKSTSLTGTGTMANSLVGEDHRASGTGVITYEGVTVKAPSGKGCEVAGGKVITNELAATTAGQGMGLKFTPATGETFAEFTIEGCGATEALKALNGVYKTTGSVIGTPEGATTVTTHAGTTAQATLKLRGQNAGIAGALEIEGATGTPIAATTFT